MFKSNCHTHTIYCDGKNTAREMVEAAIEKGFVSLGFSGHSPMKDKNDWTMSAEDVSRYAEEINSLKGEYADKIDILCGIELDADYSDAAELCEITQSGKELSAVSYEISVDGSKLNVVFGEGLEAGKNYELVLKKGMIFSVGGAEIKEDYILNFTVRQILCRVKNDGTVFSGFLPHQEQSLRTPDGMPLYLHHDDPDPTL